MIRQIIKIDENKCNGCGLCVNACHEGAIKLIDGKAKLIRDDYCDGLGNCLPVCPTGAITFEEREALAFDEKAAMAEKSNIEMINNKNSDKDSECSAKPEIKPLACGCPGTHSKLLQRKVCNNNSESLKTQIFKDNKDESFAKNESFLQQWPVQIKLVPVNAPYFNNASLLVAADCCAYAYGNFHNDFIKNKITVIGCPKLDDCDYSEKLSEIIKNNNIKSVTVVRMEVPCCSGIENAVKQALIKSGKMIPWKVVVISTEGDILENI